MKTVVKQAFLQFAAVRTENAFTPRSSRYLNCPSNLIGHDHPNKPPNGVGNNGKFQTVGQGAALGFSRPIIRRGSFRVLQGNIDLDIATPVAETAIPDALFERGL